MSNFKQVPNIIDPLVDGSFTAATTNYRFNNIDYKYYVYLINGDGKYASLTTESIELLNIKDNILDMAASGTLIFRNDNDCIERTNLNVQLNQETNYFTRQPKNDQITFFDEFFFRNDCRDYIYVYIKPDLKDLNTDEDIDSLNPNSILFYTFSVVKNSDITTTNDSNIKFKELKLIDRDLEILREKNISFSSSKINPAETNKDLAHEDDSDRGAYTGVIIKELLKSGLNFKISDESPSINQNIIDNNYFDAGTSTLFYSSPGEYNILDDIEYVLQRHTSSQQPHDPCILRKDRYSHLYTLISYKDYFRNAVSYVKLNDETVSLGGPAHLETIYLNTESTSMSNINNTEKRTPIAPYNNFSISDFSMVENFSYHNMSGLDSQSKLISTAVHSYQLSDKQFQIDLTNNNIIKSLNTYFDTYVRGDKEYPLFTAKNNSNQEICTNIFLNTIRKNNLNYKNTFSINDTEPDQRLGFGRNSVLKNAIFLNNAIELDLKGLTFRSAGKFFSFDRKWGYEDSKFDDKVFGTYFCTEVNHIFTKTNYANKLIGVKTYLFKNPKVKEVI